MAFQPSDEAALAVQAALWPPDVTTIVDFDGTLLLRNSTELYLRSLRPRFIARLSLAMLELIKPWNLLTGENASWVYRDWLRVMLLTSLLPWSPWLWRRRCGSIARDHVNAALVQALQTRASGTVVVATYGFQFLVGPLLAAMECAWPLCVSGSVRGSPSLRRLGKAEAAGQALGPTVLRRSVLVTDSSDDRDFLPLCGQAFLLTPTGDSTVMTPVTGYLPLQYLHYCKRKGDNAVVRVILFYDLVALFIAFGPASLRPIPCLFGLLFFQLAFWTIYEIGNWENDVLGAVLEDKPRVPPDFTAWRDRMRPVQAWMWASGLSLLCAACLAAALAPGSGAGWSVSPTMVAALFAGLLAYLATVRLLYALYNRVDIRSRVFVYPLMQIGKGVGLAVLLPVAPAGFMLLVSVVLVRQLRYVAYRYAETREALKVPVNLHVITCFMLLCAAVVALTGTTERSFWLVAVAVVAWHLQRGRRDLLDLARQFEWLPSRQRSAAMSTDWRITLKNAFPASWRLERSVARARKADARQFDILSALCKPDSLSLDVGANRGIQSAVMRGHSGAVVAFEPNARYAAFLRRALPDIRVVEAAASDREGAAMLRVPDREAVSGMGTIDEANTIREPFQASEVRTLTLDSLDLAPVGCIKMDVEGHELAALRGATGILRRDRPNLLIEAEERHRPGAVQSVAGFLAGEGYQGLFVVRNQVIPIEQFDPAVHQRKPPHDGGEYVNDFFFVPREDAGLLARLLSATPGATPANTTAQRSAADAA